MSDAAHLRLMVSRGRPRPIRIQDSLLRHLRWWISQTTKHRKQAALEKGLALYTVHVRRWYPDVQDPNLNSHSKLNCIIASIQVAKAGIDGVWENTGTIVSDNQPILRHTKKGTSSSRAHYSQLLIKHGLITSHYLKENFISSMCWSRAKLSLNRF